MATAATAANSSFIPFHRASVGQEEIDEVLSVLQSGWLTTGPRARQFEAAFAEYLGAAHAVSVNSCTAALHLALAAIGLEEGDEVILPSMTFAATGEVVLYFRARPVLVDSTEQLFHTNAALIERAITPRTKAILPVHYSGYAHDLHSILEIAHRHGLRVIEDAAHAFPSRYDGKNVGTIGDITCFSFYATKTITTAEGGMITTHSSDLADRMRMLSLHGISRDAWKRYTAEGSWRYDIEAMGYKYNLSDLQAAIGLAQLRKGEILRQRRAILAARYTQYLGAFDAIAIPNAPANVDHAWHLYVVQVREGVLKIGRDQVTEELRHRGIGTSVHFIPLHLHPLYQKAGYASGQFPNAERHFASAISLPLFPDMTFDEQDRVIQALQDVTQTYRR